jgi:hypothetical protein
MSRPCKREGECTCKLPCAYSWPTGSVTARFGLQNTAARHGHGHGDGGATTLRHYSDPVSEVDRRAAAYLADLTGSATAPARSQAPAQ